MVTNNNEAETDNITISSAGLKNATVFEVPGQVQARDWRWILYMA